MRAPRLATDRLRRASPARAARGLATAAVVALAAVLAPSALAQQEGAAVQEYAVPAGSRPHDVAPAADGGVWYTAQGAGALGRLDPDSGATRHIALGEGSRPHGVIVGPEGDPWITDGGLNAIVRVDAGTEQVQVHPLPEGTGYANLNTAAFDGEGRLWFTGQSGIYGRFDPRDGSMRVWPAPRGAGPYGITATPGGAIYYASLAGSYVGRIDTSTGEATVLEPPTPNQGTRRVWSDGDGRIWSAQWNAGQVALYDPADGSWREWPLPGDDPSAYAVYVDERGHVWLSDFGGATLWRFDPETESFQRFDPPTPRPQIRQLLGRPGEVWGAGSRIDTLIVVRTPRP